MKSVYGYLRLSLFLCCLPVLWGCIPPSLTKTEQGVPAAPSSVYVAHSPLPSAPEQAQAGVSLEGKRLTLTQCINIAIRQNPSLRASWSRIKEALSGVEKAHSAYLPRIDLSAEASRSKTLQNGMDTITGSFETGISLRYLLFDGGRRRAEVQAAISRTIVAGFQHNGILLETTLKVERAYYQVLSAEEALRVAEQTLKQSRYHVELARARYKNGLVTKADLLRAKTEEADARLQLVKARSLLRQSLGRLATVMGLRPTASFEVAELPEGNYKQQLKEIDSLMQEAARQRPELQAAVAGIGAADAELQKAEADYRPEIQVKTDYGWHESSFPPDRDHWSAVIGLSFPLFEGFSRKAEIRRARSAIKEARAGYERLLRDVQLEVWDAYTRLIEAGKAIEVAHSFVESARETAQVTEGEYKNGLATIVDLIDAQTALTRAKLRLVQARLDWHTSMSDLERATGSMMTENFHHQDTGGKRD